MRIGNGYDVHKLVYGRKLIIGGIEIPFELGLLGHSDADVLVHAIMDSMLGACAAGDIGLHFPDSNQKYKDADSLKLLAETLDIISKKGYRIVNIDSVIVAQRPRLMPYIPRMISNIAETMGLDEACVSVKATTAEGLGFAGKGEGIAAYAVCLLENR